MSDDNDSYALLIISFKFVYDNSLWLHDVVPL